MKIAGIISEFNPFHNGHKYIIDKIKSKNDCVIAVMSGNYVQRGEPAVIEKHVRVRAALLSGVDLVIELPSPWSSSFAENFSIGAVSVLKETNVDSIYFGSECGNIDALKTIVEKDSEIKIEQKKDETFAKARERELEKALGEKYSKILSGSNDNLGIEYIKAANKLNFNPEFKAIKRIHAKHDSKETSSSICSASLIRENIDSSLFLAQYTPIESFKLYLDEISNGRILDIEKYSNAVISHLRRQNDFSNLPDISEGLDMKLKKEIANAENLDDLMEAIKSKRYTLARIRRLILSAFLEQTDFWCLKSVPYLNILGMSSIGEIALKSIAKSATVPLYVSGKTSSKPNEDVEILFNQEAKRNDIYASLLKRPYPCGLDYTVGIIKI